MRMARPPSSPSLHLLPVSLRCANAFVQEHHRHHRPVQGAKFAIAVALSGSDGICGVAIVGRPVARHLDDGWTLEVTRLCTNGAPNACSKLYGAAWKAAKALGYTRLLTYTLPEEGGASLRAAGWRLVGARGGGAWSRPGRPRADTPEHLRGPKCLWQAPGADKGKGPVAD
ncbi:XF1762 family protein [Pseudomonas aeruginosa]|uniref:XF1762 family protein n=2 Tax=Pseudomonadota TaxID=1224 RepID=UPI000A8A5FE6